MTQQFTRWHLPKRNENIYLHKDLYMKTWKQPKCPSIGKRTNQLYIQYSIIFKQ